MTDQRISAQSPVEGILRPSRREFLALGGAAATSVWFAGSARTMEKSVSGRVVVSEDGRMPAVGQARGLDGVLVSNGLDIVRTDANGDYRIKAPPEGQVFLVKPAHFAVALDSSTMLPRHYRDIGDGARHDFILVRTPERKSFDVALIADPQPEHHRHLDFIRDGAVPLLAKTNAAFGLALGDLVGDNLDLLGRYNAIAGQAGFPWWNVGGNHDLDVSAPDHWAARAPFRSAYGPATYAFEYGKALFVVLDNVDYGGAAVHGGSGRYRGRIGRRQLTFLRNLLAHTPREKLIVLCMHIPLRTDWNAHSVSDNTQDADALLQLLAGRRAISFSGHMHAAEHQYLPYEAPGGRCEHHHQVLCALSGSWWSGPFDPSGRPVAMAVDGAPPGFHVLHINGDQHRTTFVPLVQPQQRVRVVLSRCTPCRESGAHVIDGLARPVDLPCELVVNVFDGGPKTRVRYRLPGSEWRDMTKSRRADPFVIDHFSRADAWRHDWVKPEPCEHLWVAPVPIRQAGLHRAEIEALDEFGTAVREIKAFELA